MLSPGLSKDWRQRPEGSQNTFMTQRYAIAVFGEDRPGIVADASAALLTLDANLEDVSTSILRGHFALMLIVATEDEIDRAQIEAAMRPLRAGGLALGVWEVSGPLQSVEATHVLTVYGPDRTGIVHAVSRALADLGVNISDMVCRLHEGVPPVYVVTTEVALADDLEPARVEEMVRDAVEAAGLEMSLRPLERSEL
jgi:glycine cleavage system transcriptional repressor